MYKISLSQKKDTRGGGSANWISFFINLFFTLSGLLLLYNASSLQEAGRPKSISTRGSRNSDTKTLTLTAAAAAASTSSIPRRKRLALVVLCRESDTKELIPSIHSFDLAYSITLYPRDLIVFSDKPWSISAQNDVSAATSMKVIYVVLDSTSEWTTPTSVNRSRFDAILSGSNYYGNTESYRHMCRFFAGPIFLNKALQNYDYAWRMDSHVRYLCDLQTPDPIERMISSGAVYGYVLRQTEHLHTVPTLWQTMAKYAKEKNLVENLRLWNVQPDQSMPKVCHYWNNFEITNLDFFRSESYQALFRYLDESGGFFYERWGDAPVRTFALMLLSEPRRVLQFEDVAYQHPWWYKCTDTCKRGKLPINESKCIPDPEIQPHQSTDGKICRIGE